MGVGVDGSVSGQRGTVHGASKSKTPADGRESVTDDATQV